LVATVLDTITRLTDDTVALFDRAVGRMFRRAEVREQDALMRDARAINDKVRLLAKLGAALIEARESGARFAGGRCVRDRLGQAGPQRRRGKTPGAPGQSGSLGSCGARLAGFHRLGRLRDRAVEAQQYRASGLALVTAAIALWNTVYLDRALDDLRCGSEIIPEALLAHLAPIGWQHINLTGDYLWDVDVGLAPDGFRALRTTATSLRPAVAA
jgi:hypothetical protein